MDFEFPIERIRAAVDLGASAIRDAGFIAEHHKVAIAVERHR
jgi:hypothetical protein